MKKRRKIGLKIKFTVLFILFAILLAYEVEKLSVSYYRDSYMEQYAKSGKVVAKMAASIIDGDKLLYYCETKKADENYEKTEQLLSQFKTESGVEYLYVTRPLSDDSAMFVYDATIGEENSISGLGAPCAYTKEDVAARETFETGIASDKMQYTKTDYGYLASVFAPVKTAKGETVGLVGVDFEMQQILDEVNEKIEAIQNIIFILIVACFVILLFVITITIVHPIRILNEKVSNTANGILGEQVPVRGHDEITQISETFNYMSIHIKNHLDEITDLSNGYYKFVPAKLFQWLGRESVIEVQLGDQTKVNAVLLMMQVDDFLEVTEQMSTQEVFQFINGIYDVTLPYVMEQEGIIQAFDQAGFQALYLDQGKQALDTAILIQQRLNRLKQKRKENQEISYSMAITQGTVMLGIVGHEERLEAVTISRQKSIGSYLKEIAHKYRAEIIITGSVAESIKNFHQNYHSRFLGFLWDRVEGTYLKLYDVYDGDALEERRNKEDTKETFEKGVQEFEFKNFYQARLYFIEVLKQDRMDYAAREYLNLCDRYYKLEDTSGISIAIEQF